MPDFGDMDVDDIAAAYVSDGSDGAEEEAEAPAVRIKGESEVKAERRKQAVEERKAEAKRAREAAKEEKKREQAAARELRAAPEGKREAKRERELERGQKVLAFKSRQQQRLASQSSIPGHLMAAGAAGEGEGAADGDADDEDIDVGKFLRQTDGETDDVDALLPSEASAADIFFSNLAAPSQSQPEELPAAPPPTPEQPAPAPAPVAGPKGPPTPPPCLKRAAPPEGAAPGPAKRNFTVQQAEPQGAVDSSAVTSFDDGATENISAPASGGAVPQRGSAPAPSGLQFYMTDAREDTGGMTSGAVGTLFLFGKMLTANGFESVCVQVRGLQRQVLFVPRPREDGQELTQADLLTAQRGVLEFAKGRAIDKRKVKIVERSYAFEESDVPRDASKWVKLSYPAKFPSLGLAGLSAEDVQRRLPCVTHAFGDGRSFLEMFLLKRRVMGPSWLCAAEFNKVSPNAGVSHCKHEFEVNDFKTVSVVPEGRRPPTPPLRVMSVGIATQLNDAGGHKVNEVVGMSCVTFSRVSSDGLSPQETPKRWAAVRSSSAQQDMPMPHLIAKEFAKAKLPAPVCEKTERQLLMHFLDEVALTDPDVLVGHNFMGFDLDVLLHRMERFKVPNWSLLGRLRQRHMPRLQHGAGGTGEATWEERNVVAGRLVADSYLLSREYQKAQNYKLRALAHELRIPGVLGKPPTAAQAEAPPDVPSTRTPEEVFDTVVRCDDKALLSWRLLDKLQAIPLTKRLTCLAGNLWQRTLLAARAERIEYLLLHRFHEAKFVVPDKQRRPAMHSGKRSKEAAEGGEEPGEQDSARKKAKYLGGMVLEPEKGLYNDYVLLLDFNSLYPSLIQEYKICFTTVKRPEHDGDTPGVPDDSTLICTKCAGQGARQGTHSVSILNSCQHRCLLAKGIRELVLARRELKAQLKRAKDGGQRAQLDIQQKALKLTANSIYGCLGFENSRFYAQSLAQLVTLKGREALGATKSLVDSMKEATSVQVIYGDTDSVMIRTGIMSSLKDALAIAHRVKAEVNKRYSLLEIDIDGVFRSLLLVRKKKYAALSVVDWQGEGKQIEQEVKGLDLVRRDWCSLSAQVQREVLNECLGASDDEAVVMKISEHLSNVANRVRCAEGFEAWPLEKYIIRKSLTRELDRYADAANQPHVQVAKRMREKQQSVQVGDIIQYVICTKPGEEAEKGKLASRAYHPDDLREAGTDLTIDAEWYLATQVHPPVARLCEHIPNLDSHVVASMLGIEESKYVQHISHTAGNAGGGAQSQSTYIVHASPEMTLDDRFPQRSPVTVRCVQCKAESECDPVAALVDEAARVAEHTAKTGALPREQRPLLRCPSCSAPISCHALYNTVLMSMRQRLRTYYSHEYGLETSGPGAEVVSTHVKREYRESALREQCQYLSARFWSEKEIRKELRRFWNKLDDAKRSSLGAALGQEARSSARFCDQDDLPHLSLFGFLQRVLTAEDGTKIMQAMQPLADYTRVLPRSHERTFVTLAGFWQPLYAKGTQRVTYDDEAPLTPPRIPA
eukprot:TRINITY_DN12545_c0_g1_i1.p1 TRINITY_DN12545_c0_g1~~TRINITY_DN12545_c0_g1_i1.p1  ORF type:complete len:1559 (+),score=590.23 TRINITY_DN12545_c0_g1_i1:109-4677(+)